MEYKDILYDKKDGIAKITLNRPRNYNAFSVSMLEGWHHALQDAGKDHEVKVITVTGAGKAFCAGGDVKSMRQGRGFLHREGDDSEQHVDMRPRDYKESLSRVVHRIPLALRDIDKPVIAVINGPAMGAGLDMALMCDLRVASDRAVLGASYINVGLVPGDGGAFLLPRLVGTARALELLWSGGSIHAREALDMGLVNKVFPAEQLEEKSREFALKIASKSPQAVRCIKRLVYQGLNTDFETALDSAASNMSVIACSRDHREALNAFWEKRPPEFTDE